MESGLLLLVAYFNYNTWIRIDKKHRQYYMTFIINIILCLITIAVIIYKELYLNIFAFLIAEILLLTTFLQRKSMIMDLEKGRFERKEEMDKKKR